MKLPSFLHACIGLTLLSVGTCLSLAILDFRNLEKARFQVEENMQNLADHHAHRVEQDFRIRLDAALEEVT
ncbi:MAG: hypothetical protein ABSG26_04005 [Bryobacteraceae bacterium]|jgi:hypothetical protein